MILLNDFHQKKKKFVGLILNCDCSKCLHRETLNFIKRMNEMYIEKMLGLQESCFLIASITYY